MASRTPGLPFNNWTGDLMRLAFAMLIFCLFALPAHAVSDGKEFLRQSYTQHGTITLKHKGRQYTGRATITITPRTAKAAKRLAASRQKASPHPPVQQWGASDLVARARAYMGTNPTGWGSLWCGRFMAMIAPEAAKRVRNPNMARDWAALPNRSRQCAVGRIAVLSRGKGGHVGVVSDCTPRGPKIVSGNHNRKVGEAVYPRHRVLVYVAAL